MRQHILRFLTILAIIYGSMFGGVVEHLPLIDLIHQVGIFLLLLVWLVDLWVRKRPFPRTKLDWPLWGLGGAWLLGALLTPYDRRASLEYVWQTLAHIFIFYIFVDLFRSHKQRWIIEGLFMMGAIIVLSGVAEMVIWYFGLSSGSVVSISWPQLFGFTIPPLVHPVGLALNHKNPTGAYCLLLIPLLFAWGETLRQRDLAWAARLLGVALMIMVIFTQSRGAYLGLAAIISLSVLTILLRDEVRACFPRSLQPLLAPRLLVGFAFIAGTAAFGVVFRKITLSPGSTDLTRLDIWYSAIRIFKAHPWFGVGRHQFGVVRLWYSNWEVSPDALTLQHAHNMLFNIVAEGGLAVLIMMMWVIVRFCRLWWAAWRAAAPASRRRLEAILIALIAFAIHNSVDSFLQTQLMIPVLIMAAYVATAQGTKSDPQPVKLRPAFSRAPIAGALSLLLVVQMVFIPVHWAGLAQARALRMLDQDRPLDALKAVEQAEDADPWMNLYLLQKAYILGVLADQQPDTYLADAIVTHEKALKKLPVWDIGWHNLAALYAQAGDYEKAVAAEQQAISWNKLPSGYYLKLGEYYEHLGQTIEARIAYIEALRRQSALASSAFWTDPGDPPRAGIPAEAVAYYLSSKPANALDIAVYSGQIETAIKAAQSMDYQTASEGIQLRLKQLRDAHPDTFCTICYYLAVQDINIHIRDDLVIGESLLQGIPVESDLTAEEAAKAAIFFNGGKGAWAWYILARLPKYENSSEVEAMLARAVPAVEDHRLPLPMTAYFSVGNLGVIPQAQTPVRLWLTYAPWLELASRYAQEGKPAKEQQVYKAILEEDPYACPLLPAEAAPLCSSES